MRFRDWPPRRIGVMWVFGIILQLLLLYVVPPLLVITRTPFANGDTLLRISSDSSFLELRLSGDTVRATNASPNVERAAASYGRGLADVFVEIGRAIVILLLMIIVIPLTLSATTLAWWILRRRRAPA
jgi:hypothetical protein